MMHCMMHQIEVDSGFVTLESESMPKWLYRNRFRLAFEINSTGIRIGISSRNFK